MALNQYVEVMKITDTFEKSILKMNEMKIIHIEKVNKTLETLKQMMKTKVNILGLETK